MTYGEKMNFDQISKTIYSDISFQNQTDSFALIKSIFEREFNCCEIAITQNVISSFVHKSYKNENQILIGHNERLEFFGDAVLQLIVSELLIKTYPALSEGKLSQLRSQMVNENSLAVLAESLEFSKWILLGKGELKELGYQKPSILADAFEAFLGAIYLDFGTQSAQSFVEYAYETFRIKVGEDFISYVKTNSKDVKSHLQELVMKKFKVTPLYESNLIKEEGKEFFRVHLKINGKIFATEVNASKKKAIQILAKKVIQNNLI